MFIQGLSKKEREEASRFNPKDWEGDYVKINVSYSQSDKYHDHDKTCYYKLSQYIDTEKCSWSGDCYLFKGFGIDEYNQPRVEFRIRTYYDTYVQYEIVPISRDEFIEGCKSLLTNDLKNLINWDKI
jgi:hypothetical protein